MKFLLIVLLAAVVLWLWRSQRRVPPPTQGPAPSSSRNVTDMVACDVCQVHLPRTDAITSGRGTFCSEAHRRQGGA